MGKQMEEKCKIKDLTSVKDFTEVLFDGLITEKKTKTTAGKKDYLVITVQDDETSGFEFPVWDNYEYLNEVLDAGKVITVKGKKNTWEGTVQIKDPKFRIAEGEVDLGAFVPTYKIPSELINKFENMVTNMEHKWRILSMAATGCLGYEKKRWNTFLTSVSAAKHHGNKRGGLFLHTYGVLRTINSQIENYINTPHFYDASSVINPDKLRFKAIMHDIAKPEEYDYNGIIRYKPEMKTDHTVNGIIYLYEINHECGDLLTKEELEDIKYSILSHHGQWGKYEPKSLEDWLLHIADLTDARIVGEVEK
jgi:23S rRNA maturation-related 3'-5' exoribonuclease YhaM